MRIIIFSNSLNNYLNFRLGLIKKLVNENKEIYAVVPNTKNTEKIKKLGVEVINLKLSRHSAFFITELFLIVKIFFIYKKIKPDYALHFTIKPNLYGSIICKLLNIKSINNITGLGTVFLNKKYLRKFYHFLYRYSFKNSYHCFFQNNYDLRYFKKNYLIEKNYSLIPGSGVDIKLYNSLSYPADDNINFLFIGRLIREKGIYEYLEAANQLKKEFNNINFLISGSLDEHNKSNIKKEILDKYINDNTIIYLGYINDIKKVIDKSHAIILPSYREGMSHTLLVGASMSRPLIASNVPGCKELINDNLNGYLFKKKNTYSLINSIKKFIKLNYKEKILMGKKSRLLIERSYDENIVINKYLEYLK